MAEEHRKFFKAHYFYTTVCGTFFEKSGFAAIRYQLVNKRVLQSGRFSRGCPPILVRDFPEIPLDYKQRGVFLLTIVPIREISCTADVFDLFVPPLGLISGAGNVVILRHLLMK